MDRTDCLQCHKSLTPIQIRNGRQFCSKHCKNESQKRRITLICVGCSKKFKILPYLKRKSNYCSMDCYHRSTKRKIKRSCIVCRKDFLVKAYLVQQGFGLYCSRKCQHAAYPSRITILCAYCNEPILTQPSKIKLTKFCSKKCSDDSKRDYVEKVCKHCQKHFQLPSWETRRGKGSFCSKCCFLQYKGESSIEKKVRYALQKAHINFLQEAKIGKYRADFLLPQHNLVIECDGDYWHKIPGIEARDKRKDRSVQELGYSIVRFTEKEIRKASPDNLHHKISQITGLPLLRLVWALADLLNSYVISRSRSKSPIAFLSDSASCSDSREAFLLISKRSRVGLSNACLILCFIWANKFSLCIYVFKFTHATYLSINWSKNRVVKISLVQ